MIDSTGLDMRSVMLVAVLVLTTNSAKADCIDEGEMLAHLNTAREYCTDYRLTKHGIRMRAEGLLRMSKRPDRDECIAAGRQRAIEKTLTKKLGEAAQRNDMAAVQKEMCANIIAVLDLISTLADTPTLIERR